MSLLTSLYSGTSGLNANSTELSVVGDNIANANTIGFKASRAAFQDALSQSLIGDSGQLGLGTKLQAIQKIITQGALTNTGLATDLALQGPGMFIVRGSYNGFDSSFFTRAGQFTLDKEGLLVNLDGLRVQGYVADANGNLGALGDLQVGNATAPAKATENIGIKGNLKADDPIPTAPFSLTDPTGTSNFSTSVTAYDSLGKAHQMDVYFRKTAAGTWDFYALTDGANVQGGTPGTPSQVANGTLTFDASGRLTSVAQSSNFSPNGAVTPQPLTFDFGDPTGAGGTGLEGMTQFASTSAMTFQTQDGYAAGALANVQVDGEGNVLGTFTNGLSRNLGRVAIAAFSAADKLVRAGGNLYKQGPASGEPTIGGAGSGGRGTIVAGALEQSNVDLAQEFVRMIAAQRGFQANSKTITTADQLLGELMQLKR